MTPLPRWMGAVALAGAIVALAVGSWLAPAAWAQLAMPPRLKLPSGGHLTTPAQTPGVLFVDDDAGCGGRQPCYATIQTAVDAAADGEIVRVAPGRYAETVLVENKGLAFEGPGVGDPGQPFRLDQHAVWVGQSGPARGVALMVDAGTGDIRGLRVQGFRFVSATVGVLLLGRQADGSLPLPPGRPGSAVNTALVDATVQGNLFADVHGSAGTLRGAVVAVGPRGLVVTGNDMGAGSSGVAVWAGSQVEITNNTLSDVTGPGVLALTHGNDISIAGNVIAGSTGRGIEVRDLNLPGPASAAQGLTLRGNQVTDTASEGIAVLVESGGTLAAVTLAENRVTDAGTTAPPGVLTFLGGIALQARNGRLEDIGLAGDVVRRTRQPARTDGAGLYLERVGGRVAVTQLLASDGLGPGVLLVDVPELRLSNSVVTRNQVGVVVAETPSGAGGGLSLPATAALLVLGGSPALANRLGDNVGGALVLENRGSGQTPTSNVLATHNDWGVPYAPDIEALVRHEPDDPGLGRVTYLPAMAVPETVALLAEPPRLVADGLSFSQVTATVQDLGGLPVADGALVSFATDLGQLDQAGAIVEAEGADVSRLGQWTLYANQVFGPFSGSGYLRTRDPGARLVWDFEGPALALAFGQGVSGAGVFRAQVDGQELGLFNTTGPERAWAWRLLARDLAAGPHTVTVTLQAGELNVDALVSGLTTERGQANVQLGAPQEVGLAHLTATVVGAAGVRTATLAVPFTAGPPAMLHLGLQQQVLPVGGVTTTVTAEVRDERGRPVPDDTPVHFSASEGSVSPPVAPTRDGQARAVVASGLVVGPALIRAESGAAADEVELTYVPGPPAALELAASRASLAANSAATADVTVQVRDAWGHAVSEGTPVTLTTSLGQLDLTSLVTSAGLARTRFRVGAVAGSAVLRAASDGATGATTITLVAPDLRVGKWVEPQSVVLPGEMVTYTLNVANVSSGTVYDAVITDIVPAGLLPGTVTAQGLPALMDLGTPAYRWHVPRLRPGEQGAITLTMRVDPDYSWSPRTEVRNQVALKSASAAERSPADNVAATSLVVVPFASYTVTLTVPERLMVGGTTGPVQAKVVDKAGRSAPDGTMVYFAADLGSVTPTAAPTQGGVARVTFVTGTRAGTAVVRAETQEERGATGYVRIVPGPLQRLDLVSDSSWLRVGGESTVVTATLSDAYANPVTKEPVLFTTTMGSFEVAGDVQSTYLGETGPTGAVTTTLISGARMGTATVTAQSGMVRSRLYIPFRPGWPELVSIRLSRDQITVGETVTVTGIVADAYGNPVSGVPVAFASQVGQLASKSGVTDDAGEAETTVYGQAPGFGMVSVTGSGRTAFTMLTVQQVQLHLPLVLRPR